MFYYLVLLSATGLGHCPRPLGVTAAVPSEQEALLLDVKVVSTL